MNTQTNTPSVHEAPEQAGRKTEIRKHIQESLRQPNHLHRRRDGLRHEEDDPDRPEAPADEKIGAAAIHPRIRSPSSETSLASVASA
jgi:hypothetical protein